MGFSAGDHFLVILFVGMVALFGMAILFVRSTIIERTLLVGGLTLVSSSIAGYLLASPTIYSTGGLIGIAALSMSGYVVGRIIDRLMGPMDFRDEMDENTLGAELAD